MSQKLMSAEFYQEPSEDEILAEVEENLWSRDSWRSAKYFLNVVFWIAVIGGGGFTFHRAVSAASKPKVYTGSGAQPTLDMMSFWMSFVDWNWDKRVEDRIRSNQRPPLEKPNMPDLPPMRDPIWNPSRATEWTAARREMASEPIAPRLFVKIAKTRSRPSSAAVAAVYPVDRLEVCRKSTSQEFVVLRVRCRLEKPATLRANPMDLILRTLLVSVVA